MRAVKVAKSMRLQQLVLIFGFHHGLLAPLGVLYLSFFYSVPPW